MTGGTSVETGPPLGHGAEAVHRRQLAETYAEQADDAVILIEEKLAGMKASLAAAKAEAKRLRAEAEKRD